ncbi:hypothetical protein Tco_1137577 [Tanacetum coccineum]
MTTLKFADTHNMVAFLSKPAESDGFEQIMDFLNAQPIRYALTVNPTIYISLTLNNSGLLTWSKLSMGNSKTTAWNEFSSTMASAIICLATNQKFNFSKYIFESMVRNLDNLSGKFLMYPRFASNYAEWVKVPQPSGPIDIVADEVVHKELGDSLVRATTTASSLEAEQDSGNITKTRSKATPNEAVS